MHQYLKAIGFGNLSTKKELKEILNQVEKKFTHQTIISYNKSADFCEFEKEFGQQIGIALYGEMDENENFDADYYMPYFQGGGITTYSEVIVEKRIDREQYVGICEDSKVGISLIFTLKNGIDYQKECQISGYLPIFLRRIGTLPLHAISLLLPCSRTASITSLML